MKPIVTFAAAAALAGVLGLATVTPSDARGARHVHRVAAVVVAPAPVVISGGYYSNIVNPTWGYCPQFTYSIAMLFGHWGPLCGDP